MNTILQVMIAVLATISPALHAAPEAVAQIDWETLQPHCAGQTIFSQDIKSKSLIVEIVDFSADKNARRFLVTCRLQGRVEIPAGFALASQIGVQAKFTSKLMDRNDRVNVVSRVSIANLSASNSDSVDYSELVEAAIPGRADGAVELRTALSIPSVAACAESRTFRISFSNKVFINAQMEAKTNLSASFDELRISPLTLVPANCPNGNEQ